MKLPRGTLVKVSGPSDYVATALRDHGSLWVVLEYDDKWKEYSCKSVATGAVRTFLTDELEQDDE